MAEPINPSPVSDIEIARRQAKEKLASQNKKEDKKDKPKDGRSDAQLTKDISAALRGIFEVVRYVAKFFGKREIEKLTEDEASEGAVYWLPLARRYYFLAQVTLYIGAPIWLITTLSGKWNGGKKIEQPVKPPDKKKEAKIGAPGI